MSQYICSLEQPFAKKHLRPASTVTRRSDDDFIYGIYYTFGKLLNFKHIIKTVNIQILIDFNFQILPMSFNFWENWLYAYWYQTSLDFKNYIK